MLSRATGIQLLCLHSPYAAPGDVQIVGRSELDPKRPAILVGLD
jgi:hypothetical protein